MKVPLVIAGILAAGCLHADEFPNPALEAGYRQMYNLQFEQAHRTFGEWQKAHPEDPLGPVSDAAAYLFSEFNRLHILQSEFFSEDQSFLRMHKLAPDPQVKREFDDALARARALETTGGDLDAQFAEVLGNGLESDYLALIDKRYMAAVNETKQARTAAERLLARHPECYDAYLAIGVENYLLSIKPAPVRWFLHMTGAETDKQIGIDKLRLTAEKGHYLRPFARLLLAVADLRDKDRAGARQELSWLAAQFPANHLFREELAKVQ